MNIRSFEDIEPVFYTISEEIGAGGFGKVYRAQEVFDEEDVALKILNPDKLGDNDVNRFEREIKIQNQLDHKNVVPILDFSLGEGIDDKLFYTMPLADCNLGDFLSNYRVDNFRPMDDETVAYYFNQVLDAIEYVHKEGVIHRDLNPRNILVFDNTILKISDFGLGKLKKRDITDLTKTRMSMGNDIYAAPEQWEQGDAKNVDERADIFSLGKILYEMLTGNLPLNIDLESVKHSKYKYIIKKSTQYREEKRYSNIREMKNDMDLLTGKREYAFKNPSQQFNDKLAKFLETKEYEVVKEILDLLLAKNEYILYTKNFMSLDTDILKVMSEQYNDKYSEVIQNYFSHIEGNHTYSFTDNIALFLLKIYDVDHSNDELFEKVFQRLLTLAYDHNRFYIGDKFSSTVAKIDLPQYYLILLDIFKENEEATMWMKPYLEEHPLPNILTEYLSSI